MTPEQYDSLSNTSPPPIKVGDLIDQTPRLLISTVQGLASTVDTNIFLTEYKQFLINYNGESHVSEFIYPDLMELHEVDWKTSDYDFCKKLMHKGARLYFYEGDHEDTL